MAKRTYGNNYDELVGVRIPIKHRNILEARASERNSSISEVLREIIAVAVEAMEEIQNRGGPTKRIEYVEENPTSEYVRSVLESKGLYSPREKKRTGVEFRADGHRK